MTIFFRALSQSVDEKARALRQAILAFREDPKFAIEIDPSKFAEVPGSPFSYWVSNRVRSLFQSLGSFETAESSRRATKGLATTDDFQFLRVWWELAEDQGRGWMTFAKGGTALPYYADLKTCILWRDNGAQLKAYLDEKIGAPNQWSRWINSTDFYGRQGLTWPLRAARFSPAVLPKGSIFSVRGYAAFGKSDELLPMLALLNSRILDYMFKVTLGRFGHPEFVVGVLQLVPWPELRLRKVAASMGELARRAWSLKRSLETGNETSHAFLLPTALNERVVVLHEASAKRELDEIQAEVDDVGFALYGISAEDRASIEASADPQSASESDEGTPTDDNDEGEDEVVLGSGSELLISWLVGVAFGRFDLRLATGQRTVPSEPDPFDALPSRSPGMYPVGERPANRADILVDDEGHTDDIPARAEAIAERVRVDVPENLRAWLAKEFFPLHIKMYSKSRRKAPIYWQLATPSASYSVWLYIHAFSRDTIFRVQNDYVAPKLAHEERRLEALTDDLRHGATAAQRKQLAAQHALVEELRTFLDEVRRVAPLWNPNLDDGVVINFAPLWRLVPQNKSWQKELQTTWDSLSEGEYDWGHLAMHLWPERVIPKCAKDRSLAIAHGLEDVFWVEGKDGRWTARKTPTRAIDGLVREHTSAAVKAALRNLLEAPTPGNATRSRRGRRGSAAVDARGD